MRRRILIIGGSYFAGRVFVEELVKDGGAEIHVFNRGRFPLGIPGVAEHVGDREDAAQIRAAIPAGKWDAVVDFCAYTPAHVATLLENLPGDARQYVLVSTTSVYRQSPALPLAEDAAKLDGREPELGDYADYGYDKWRAENTLTRECAPQGIATTVLRPAIIYGYYNYAPRETYFFDRLFDRQPIVIPLDDLALYSFVWVVDMARLIIRCLGDERTFGEAFNLAGEELVSYSRIVAALAEITGREILPLRLSTAEIARQGIALPFPADRHLVYSGTKIRRLFDFADTPLKSGLREALRYSLMLRKRQAGSA